MTKEPISISATPASAKARIQWIFAASGMMRARLWSPSRGPTSLMTTSQSIIDFQSESRKTCHKRAIMPG